MVPVMNPFLFRQYDIESDRFIHSKTQNRKGPADRHFTTAMWFADKYIDEKELDVVTPRDIV